MMKRTSRRSLRTNKESGGFIPTGLTLLDLACSGRMDGGFRPGSMVNIIGDKHTGKTLLALSCLAQTVVNGLPHKVQVYNTESDLGFDMGSMFGPLVGKLDHIVPEPPYLIEDWRNFITKQLDTGEPCIHVLDSMDALTCEDEQTHLVKKTKARQKGEEVKGTYGTAKAIANSQILRSVMGKVKQSNSVLIIVSQTRDNIGNSFVPKSRSGGKALDFYAWHIMWLHHRGKLDKTVRGNKVETGNATTLKLTKNKETGRQWAMDWKSYWDYGVDDVESMIEFMVKWKFWSKPSGTGMIEPRGEFGSGPITKAGLIQHIEDNELQGALKQACKRSWDKLSNLAQANKGRNSRW